ncbi:MAG: 50S ribosomal protein L15 [Planctomycetota bacterium]
MNLKDVNAIGVRFKKRKRTGRGLGSGSGKTASKGTKGQQSRSGYSRKLGFEGGQMAIFRRLPKRGFTNARFQVETAALNVGTLNSFQDGEMVDLETLKARGLAKKSARRLKILGGGALERKLSVRAHSYSDSAKRKLEAAQSNVEVLA